MRSTRRKRYPMAANPEPIEPPSDRTEREDARRKARDWLRDRDEDNTMSFAEERGGVFEDYDYCNSERG